jgi:hypothetical protein
MGPSRPRPSALVGRRIIVPTIEGVHSMGKFFKIVLSLAAVAGLATFVMKRKQG